MKYLLLVHHDEAAFDKIAKEKQQQMLADSVQLTHQLHANKQYLSASPLQPAATAAIVRVRDGKSVVTDGPFTPTLRTLRLWERIKKLLQTNSQRLDSLELPAYNSSAVRWVCRNGYKERAYELASR